jgi:ubiquinone biosynthesis protein COQ9
MTESAELVAAKDALLEGALPNVLFDGWTRAALKAGAAALDLTDDEIDRRFPGGAAEAMFWLDDWADRRMIEALAALDLTAMKTPQRIAAAVLARLALLAPYREAVGRAMAAKASPSGAVQAARILWRTVDLIWYAAGDTATDFNYYTKRALLASVYSATLLYWLNDRSEGEADTALFLDRRLADIARIPKLKGSLTEAVRRLTGPFQLLRREWDRR